MNVYELQKYVNENKRHLPEGLAEILEEDFKVRFMHESTKIEGNTLNSLEVRELLVNKIKPKTSRIDNILEVLNNKRAYNYINELDKTDITENIIKNIHKMVVEDIILEEGGNYRNVNVRIIGSLHMPPRKENVNKEMMNFIYTLNTRDFKTPIEKAAYAHNEFVRIHPFVDGNGRTARMLMNLVLLSNNFLPISIRFEERDRYYHSLNEYDVTRDLNPIIEIIEELELERLEEYKNHIERFIYYKGDKMGGIQRESETVNDETSILLEGHTHVPEWHI